MKTPEEPLMDREMREDLAIVAPLVKASFAQLGGPNPRVLQAIRQEARKHAMQRRMRRRFLFAAKALALAASVVILASTAMMLLPSGKQTADPKVATEEALANFVLAYQGLDSDSYFN